MLDRRVRSTMRHLERLGVSVSSEHAKRLVSKERRNRKDEEKYDDGTE